MPFQVRVDVTQAVALLQRLGSNINSSIPQQTLQAGADQLVESAKGVAPVLTGRLRDSIHTTEASATRAVVEASAEYAGFVEYGTSRMSAEPYITPSIPEAVRVIQETATRLLNETIQG